MQCSYLRLNWLVYPVGSYSTYVYQINKQCVIVNNVLFWSKMAHVCIKIVHLSIVHFSGVLCSSHYPQRACTGGLQSHFVCRSVD